VPMPHCPYCKIIIIKKSVPEVYREI